MDATYANLQPLVAALEDGPDRVVVTFRCAATGTEVRAEGLYAADGLVESTAKRTKRSLFSSIRNSVASSVRQAAGAGVVGSLAGEAAASLAQNAGRDIEQGKAHSDNDREQAVVAAFASVQDQFRWDDAGARWVAATAAQVASSPFTDALQANPVVEGYDRDVLAHLLAALVAGDATVGDAERAAFAQLAPGADLDVLAAKRAPGAVDFEETTVGGARESILLIGWAVALSDEALVDAESSLLATAAKGLGIADDRAAQLQQLAQQHIIEVAIAALAAEGKDADAMRGEIEPLGDRIGLGADEAARMVIRWGKRSA